MIIRNDNLNINIGDVNINEKQFNELMKYLWTINNRVNNISVVREIVIKEPTYERLPRKKNNYYSLDIPKPKPVSDTTFIIDQTLTEGYMDSYVVDNGIYKTSPYPLFWLINGNRRNLMYNGKGPMSDEVKSIYKSYGIIV